MAALLTGAHCPTLGDSGGPEKNYQLCRVPRHEGPNGHGRMQKKKQSGLAIIYPQSIRQEYPASETPKIQKINVSIPR
jgi:hypothetical protein